MIQKGSFECFGFVIPHVNQRKPLGKSTKNSERSGRLSKFRSSEREKTCRRPPA